MENGIEIKVLYGGYLVVQEPEPKNHTLGFIQLLNGGFKHV